MRSTFLFLSTLVLSALGTLSARPAQAQTVLGATAAGMAGADTAAPAAATPEATAGWGLDVSYDLGALSFGGIGLHAGVSKGPWTGGVGYYRFESKDMFGGALGGTGEDFKLHVDFIAEARVGYYFNGDIHEGWYATAIYQAKQQTVTNELNGEDAVLTSHLLGPEIGYEWRFLAGAFLRPRLGVLYYVKSPQPGRDPVDIGGAAYDNPTHTWVDAFVTVDLGYEFDL